MEMPSGIFNLRSKPGSLVYIASELSLREIISSTACWRRSARFTAELRKEDTIPVAEDMRTLSMPEANAGNETATINPMIVTTTSISTSVMPRFHFLETLEWMADSEAPVILCKFFFAHRDDSKVGRTPWSAA